jgi:hypothetical protein
LFLPIPFLCHHERSEGSAVNLLKAAKKIDPPDLSAQYPNASFGTLRPHGVDATSFWYHFLNLASDGTRKAFEDKYAFAESMVLASFAGALVAAIQLAVVLCRA